MLLSLIFSLIAFGDSNDIGPIRANYATLIEMHKKGSYIKPDQLKEFYPGRCFLMLEPSKPFASLLRSVVVGDVKKVYPIITDEVDADYFDKVSDEQKQADFKRICEAEKCEDTIYIKTQEPLVLGVKRVENSCQDFINVSILKFSSYIVLKATYVGQETIRTKTDDNKIIDITNQTDFMACYYF